MFAHPWRGQVRDFTNRWKERRRDDAGSAGGAGAASAAAAVARDLDTEIDGLLDEIPFDKLLEKSLSGKSILRVIYTDGPSQLLLKVIERMGDGTAATLMVERSLLLAKSFGGCLEDSFEKDFIGIPEAEKKLEIIFETLRRVLTQEGLAPDLRANINSLIVRLVESAIIKYSRPKSAKRKPLEYLAESFCSNEGRMFEAVTFPDPLTFSLAKQEADRSRNGVYDYILNYTSADDSFYKGLNALIKHDDKGKDLRVFRLVLFMVPAAFLMIKKTDCYPWLSWLITDCLSNATVAEIQRFVHLLRDGEEISLHGVTKLKYHFSGGCVIPLRGEFDRIRNLLKFFINGIPSRDLQSAFFECLTRRFTYYFYHFEGDYSFSWEEVYSRSHYVFTELYQIVENSKSNADVAFCDFLSAWHEEAGLKAIACRLLQKARMICEEGVEISNIKKERAFCALFSGLEYLTAEDLDFLIEAMAIEDFIDILEMPLERKELFERLMEGEYFKSRSAITLSRHDDSRSVTFLNIVLEEAGNVEKAGRVLRLLKERVGDEKYRQVAQRTCQTDFSGEKWFFSANPALAGAPLSEANQKWAALYNEMVVCEASMRMADGAGVAASSEALLPEQLRDIADAIARKQVECAGMEEAINRAQREVDRLERETIAAGDDDERRDADGDVEEAEAGSGSERDPLTITIIPSGTESSSILSGLVGAFDQAAELEARHRELKDRLVALWGEVDSLKEENMRLKLAVVTGGDAEERHEVEADVGGAGEATPAPQEEAAVAPLSEPILQRLFVRPPLPRSSAAMRRSNGFSRMFFGSGARVAPASPRAVEMMVMSSEEAEPLPRTPQPVRLAE